MKLLCNVLNAEVVDLLTLSVCLSVPSFTRDQPPISVTGPGAFFHIYISCMLIHVVIIRTSTHMRKIGIMRNFGGPYMQPKKGLLMHKL